MAVIIPFVPRPRTSSGARDSEASSAHSGVSKAVLDAAQFGGCQHDVIEAAAELIAVCRDSYGFTLMSDGLPKDPNTLANALVALLGGLAMSLDLRQGQRPYPGYVVHFGQPQLGWLPRGQDERRALGVPDTVIAREIAEFVRPKLVQSPG